MVCYRIARRSVVLIIFIFSLIVFLFFYVLVVIVIVVVIIVAVVLRQLLSFFHCFLSFFSCWYHGHDLQGILLQRNVLRRVGLRLRLRWYIPWCHLTNSLTYNALAGCVARTNHLKFGIRRE
jgi:hypothetical protein